MVQFQSKVRFDQKQPDTDNTTHASAPDSIMTTITQDNLKAMEDRIHGQNKKDMDSAISTAISAITEQADTQSNQATFLASMSDRWEKQEEQINRQNEQMQTIMETMQAMMEGMRQLIQNTNMNQHHSEQNQTHTTQPTSEEKPYHSTSSDEQKEPDDDNDSRKYETSEDEILDDAEDDSDFLTQPKRKSTREKGSSPEAKRTLRSSTSRGGRGSTNGRAGRKGIHQNLNNRYEPLAMSNDAPSSSGSQ